MTLRDVNLKLLILLLAAGLGIIIFTAVIFIQSRDLTDQMAMAVAEMERATELEKSGTRLVEVVRAYERRDRDDNDVYEKTRTEVRTLNIKRREIISTIHLEGARASGERLESRLGLWLDQVVFYSGGARRSSKAGEMERNLRSFVRDYRGEIRQEMVDIRSIQRRTSTMVIVFGILILLVGGLWLFYMIGGVWRPMRELQESVHQRLGLKDEIIAVTVPALQTVVQQLMDRYGESRAAQNIVSSITEGLILVNPSGAIVSANKSILSMLGYQEEELVGRNFSEIYVKVKSVHVQGFFKRQETYKEEELFKTKEGNVIPVRFSSSFLFDEDMEVQGFVCIAKDITKEKRVEEELLKQNDWFKITLASIADAVITTDNEGYINYANPVAVEVLGFKDGDEGKSINQVFRPLDSKTQEPVTLLTPREMAGREARPPRQYTLERNDGEFMMIDLVQAPIRNAKGILHGTVLVFRDITEIRRAAEELRLARDRAEAALKVKSQFLANMSHEIRTPMNGVVGMTDLLLESELSGDQREIAEIIRSSGESLLSLLNDILDLSKVEAGKLELDHASFDPRRVVEEVGDLMHKRANDKGLELVILIHHDIPLRVIGDQGRLRQILLNLVSNAIKFTSRGEVVIEMHLADRRGELCVLHCDVRDTGIGMETSTLDTIFEAFTQADASTTRKFGGTGLGLAICKELCEAMGGRIWANSIPCEGSVFSFEINLVEDTHFKKDKKSLSLVGLRVLVVESNATNRKALNHQLEHLGCQVTICERAEIKGELVDGFMAAAPFRLLILDNNQAGVDMPTFLSSLKADDRFESLGILMVSSIPAHSLNHEWGPAVDRCLTKPVKLRQLSENIAEVLGIANAALPKAVKPDMSKDLEALHQYRILVAEDNPVNQKVTVGILEKAGYRCDIAHNGHEVLEAVGQCDYDLILMDCQMPEMDGLQATRAIRELEPPQGKLPIIAMTANALDGDRERCLDAGMDEYLTKPVRKKNLFEAIEYQLGIVKA